MSIRDRMLRQEAGNKVPIIRQEPEEHKSITMEFESPIRVTTYVTLAIDTNVIPVIEALKKGNLIEYLVDLRVIPNESK